MPNREEHNKIALEEHEEIGRKIMGVDLEKFIDDINREIDKASQLFAGNHRKEHGHSPKDIRFISEKMAMKYGNGRDEEQVKNLAFDVAFTHVIADRTFSETKTKLRDTDGILVFGENLGDGKRMIETELVLPPLWLGQKIWLGGSWDGKSKKTKCDIASVYEEICDLNEANLPKDEDGDTNLHKIAEILNIAHYDSTSNIWGGMRENSRGYYYITVQTLRKSFGLTTNQIKKMFEQANSVSKEEIIEIMEKRTEEKRLKREEELRKKKEEKERRAREREERRLREERIAKEYRIY